MQKSPANSNSPSVDLVDFARRYGPADVEYQGAKVTALNGDAGFRRYYRLSSVPSLMMVDSPPAKEKNLEYVQVNDLLSSNGVSVPHIHAVSFEEGVFILEDLGDQVLQGELSSSRASELYGEALKILLNIQRIDARPEWIEDYSSEKLLEEMRLFPEWFVEKLLGLTLDGEKKRLIENTFSQLAKNANEQPKTFVHRDFHCRNLMLVGSDKDSRDMKIIDFQDAVWGPITYDLISLCRDCYVRWGQQKVDEIINSYSQNLVYAKLLNTQQAKQLPRWADWMGLQRHIKVLGIFARLYLRDGKAGYLGDLPLVLRYTLEILEKYSDTQNEFFELHAWMLAEVIPAAEQQPWYKDWRTAGNNLEF